MSEAETKQASVVGPGNFLVVAACFTVCAGWGYAIDHADLGAPSRATAIGATLGVFLGLALGAWLGSSVERLLGRKVAAGLAVVLGLAGILVVWQALTGSVT